MTDLDALLNAPGDGGVPAAPGGDGMTAPAGGGDLDGLDAVLDMPDGSEDLPADNDLPSSGDDLSDLDALLEMPSDEGKPPAGEGGDEEFDWLSSPDDDGGDANLSELDALFG